MNFRRANSGMCEVAKRSFEAETSVGAGKIVFSAPACLKKID
jgi:hypothetical protein